MDRYVLVDQLKLNHEGLFDFKEFYKVLGDWFFEKGYDRYEKLNEEIEGENGKSIVIELRNWKKLSDYYRHRFKIRIYVTDMKDVEVEIDGEKKKYNQGKIQIVIDSYNETDWINKWNDRPFHYFLRVLFDKYIYKRYTEIHENAMIADVNDLHSKLKNYLNQYNYMSQYVHQWIRKNE